MPRIEQNVEIDAPISHVYSISRDVEAFPQFMADLQSLTVLERSPDDRRTVTEWVGIIQAFKMKIKWTQEDLWNPETYRDDFKMLQGDMDRMEGYWQFEPLGESRTRFISVVDYDFNVPMVGPMVKGLVKKLMTENLQSTLNAIKQRAEKGS
jgi:ribosome-associated toxin RatA of RatAB toxin-antitoxin module